MLSEQRLTLWEMIPSWNVATPHSIYLIIDEAVEGLIICGKNEGSVAISSTDSMDGGGMSIEQVGMLGGEVTSGMPKETVVSSISMTSGMYGVYPVGHCTR